MRRGLLIALLAGAGACGGGKTTPPLPTWSPELPPADVAYGVRRGLTPMRGIIHLHSPYSHDACDGEPRDPDTGAIDESCLADLRAGLCATRIDFAALTDHDDSMADEKFQTLLLQRDDDTLIKDPSGNPIASVIHCANGHDVMLTVGGENELMPIMLDRHPDGDVPTRHDIYNADDAQTMALFRSLGGLAWVAHSEQRTLDHLRELAPDGMEIYQLHANIDPEIRKDYLGLSEAGAIQAVAQFADTNPGGPEPDLALMSFIEPNTNSIDKWEALLGEGMHISGSAGTDAHENAFPITLADGERGDSYRRMLRWFANVALVTDPSDPQAIQDAVGGGRFFISFELYGTPTGFDFHGSGGAAPVEMGDEIAPDAGITAELHLPAVYQLDPSLPVPDIRGRILRVDASGSTEVAEGTGPVLTVALDQPGAYRAEVLIVPRHEGPYLGNLGPDLADKEQVWIYTNPIYVVAP